jgi:hypothetical protein
MFREAMPMPDWLNYEWKRYWVPRDGLIPTWADGFPVDPESEIGKLNAPKLLSFDQISKIPCLALLGEPGIGKSNTLEKIGEGLSQHQQDDAHRLYLDLRSYTTDIRLHHDIFASPQFMEWINGTHTLELILDSLDECLIHIRTVAAMLVDEFRKVPMQSFASQNRLPHR